MTTEHDEPPRLFESADDDLRAALGDAKNELPSEARLDAIFLKLPPGGSGGGGGDGPPAPVPPIAKVGVGGAVLGLAGVAILGGAIYLGVRANAPRAASSASTTSSVLVHVESAPTPMISDVAPAASSVAVVSSTDPLRPSTSNPQSSSATPSTSSSAPARSESDILREAQANASSSPSRAIALCDEHARLYPSGALSEEREFIRIQALVAGGRVGEARALADAFEARHPGSAHSLRLQEIVGKTKPAPSVKTP